MDRVVERCSGLAQVISRVFLVMLVLMLSACSPKLNTGGTASVLTPDFFGVGEELALQLAGSQRYKVKGQRLILTTVVDIDNLYVTSRFGRTLTESLATSLFRHGFGVVEIRKSSEILMKGNSGELILTRDAALLARQQEAGAILAGTYSLTPGSVIINLRMLDAASQQVLSVAGLELQRSRTINHLLAAGGGGFGDAVLSAYER
jgi:TolB-like protein